MRRMVVEPAGATPGGDASGKRRAHAGVSTDTAAWQMAAKLCPKKPCSEETGLSNCSACGDVAEEMIRWREQGCGV